MLWFLKSLIRQYTKFSDKIFQIIFLIESIYKSETDKNILERLHIANSKKFVDFINKKKLNFIFNLDNFKCENFKNQKNLNLQKYDKISLDFLRNFEVSENIIKDFVFKHQEFLDDLKIGDKINKNEFEYVHKINPEDIYIKIFKNNNNNIDYKKILTSLQDNNISTSSSQNNNDFFENDDINLNSFLSTISFIDSLCNICKNTKTIPIDEQIIFLKRELSDINKNLPSNIYVPFLKNSMRNSLIVHMPISELKIFRTKTRVLFMTTIEVVRIDEIIKYL